MSTASSSNDVITTILNRVSALWTTDFTKGEHIYIIDELRLLIKLSQKFRGIFKSNLDSRMKLSMGMGQTRD